MDEELMILAKQIVAYKQGKGLLVGVDGAVLDELTTDYCERLENLVNASIEEEISRLGKTEEFSRMLDDENSDPVAFLSRTIPNWEEFSRQATQRALNKLAGV